MTTVLNIVTLDGALVANDPV